MKKLLLKILSALLKWAGNNEKIGKKLDLNNNEKSDLLEWAEWIDKKLEPK